MCLHGVKAQEGAVLGGVGPARRGRAGQRWGRGGGPRSRGPTGSGPQLPGTAHSAGAERGPRLFAQREKVARPPAVPARRPAGPGQVRGAAGRCAPGGAAAERDRGVPGAAASLRRESRGCGVSSGKRRGISARGPCGGRGRGGMELPEGPASRPCGCAAAAEEQVRGILT